MIDQETEEMRVARLRAEYQAAEEAAIIANDGWAPRYTKPSYNGETTHGVDERTVDGVRYYRAWCVVSGIDQPLLSEVYAECDAADPDFVSDMVAAQSVSWRQNEVARAALVRGRMRADQASFKDMEAMAARLADEGRPMYHALQKKLEAERKQRISDEAAVKVAREMVRGLVLMPEDELRPLLARIVAMTKEAVPARSHHKKRGDDGNEEANA